MSFKAALSRNDTHRRNAEKKKKTWEDNLAEFKSSKNNLTPNTEEEKEHMSNW